MWIAIDNSIDLVEEKGTLFIAIYNDQGYKSHFWWFVKWFYNLLPQIFKNPFAYIFDFLVQT